MCETTMGIWSVWDREPVARRTQSGSGRKSEGVLEAELHRQLAKVALFQNRVQEVPVFQGHVYHRAGLQRGSLRHE